MKLECEGLIVPRGGLRVVDGVSLEVGAGELLWLQGPNGSGKSSILLAIAGRIPSKGHLRLDGSDLRARAAWEREERLPFLAQEPELQEECLAIDNLVDSLVLGPSPWRWGTMRAARAREQAWRLVQPVADALGLSRGVLEQPTRQLSVGQRRLCGLVRALRSRPDGGARVMLLDEPLAGLRGDRIGAVVELLSERLGAGWSALVSEHVEVIGQVPGLRVKRLGGA